jgi:hypothetical protein
MTTTTMSQMYLDLLVFDFKHAYLFGFSPCYVVSLQAKRDLSLFLYFDGSSAADMENRLMDSQDVVI